MCLNPIFIPGKGSFPCRKCIECRIQYSEEWARRVVLESKKHKDNCFLTLTYNEANLPKAGVCKRSAQLFIKRLRKAIAPIKVRYFLCGEYGSKFNRPHYHVILFGYDFKDKYYFCRDSKGNRLFRSPLLERLWTFGFSSVGDSLDFDTAKYCAKYLQSDYRQLPGLNPSFTLMSRRPGLALDVIPDSVYKSGDMYVDGKRFLAPRAFLKVVKRDFPDYYDKYIAPRLLSESDKLKNLLGIKFDSSFTIFDESVSHLYEFLRYKDFANSTLEKRRKKYLKIFDKSLDKFYRPLVSFKRKRDK